MDGVHIRATEKHKAPTHTVLILVVMDGVHIQRLGVLCCNIHKKVLILVVMDGVHIPFSR